MMPMPSSPLVLSAYHALSRHECVIITGPLHTGKSTLAHQLAQTLIARHMPINGISETAVFDAQGNRIGYDFFEYRTSAHYCAMRLHDQTCLTAKTYTCGRYDFDETGFKRACDCLQKTLPDEIVFVDEIGKAERSGDGLWRGVRSVLERKNNIGSVFVCRYSECQWLRSALDSRVCIIELTQRQNHANMPL